MHCTFGDHPDGASSDIWDQIWLFWAYDDLFRGQKAGFVTIGGAKGISLLIKLPFWGHQKGPVAQKWVKNAYKVMLGQYVDFGITSGAIKTSRGSKVPFTEYRSYWHDFPLLWEHMWTIESLLYRNYARKGCKRLTLAYSDIFSNFVHWFGLAFFDIGYFPPLG